MNSRNDHHSPHRLRSIFNIVVSSGLAVLAVGLVWVAMPPPVQISNVTYNRRTNEYRLERTSLTGFDVDIRWKIQCHYTNGKGSGEIYQIDVVSPGMVEVEANTTAVFGQTEAGLAACIRAPKSVTQVTFFPYWRGLIPLRPVTIGRTHQQIMRK